MIEFRARVVSNERRAGSRPGPKEKERPQGRGYGRGSAEVFRGEREILLREGAQSPISTYPGPGARVLSEALGACPLRQVMTRRVGATSAEARLSLCEILGGEFGRGGWA